MGPLGNFGTCAFIRLSSTTWHLLASTLYLDRFMNLNFCLLGLHWSPQHLFSSPEQPRGGPPPAQTPLVEAIQHILDYSAWRLVLRGGGLLDHPRSDLLHGLGRRRDNLHQLLREIKIVYLSAEEQSQVSYIRDAKIIK